MFAPAMLLLAGASALYAARGVMGALELLGRRRLSARGWLLAAQCHGIPACSRLDSVALFLWLTALAFVVSAKPYGIESVAPVFWPCFAAGMAAMWALAGRTPGEPSSFGRLWLALHLVPVYVGYAGFAVAAGAGGAYLVQEQLLRRKASGARWRRLPSLETLQRVEWAALTLGYPVLTVGLIVGLVWAYQSASPLGQAWYADPKVLGGVVVWLFYTAVLHLRLFLRPRGRRAAMLTVAGFLLTLVSFGTAHLYSEPRAASHEPRARSLALLAPKLGARRSALAALSSEARP
jgi:ABC-type transport system involved in cytochrome c biogenesis permease subunit